MNDRAREWHRLGWQSYHDGATEQRRKRMLAGADLAEWICRCEACRPELWRDGAYPELWIAASLPAREPGGP